jgi:alpha-tubulin suppressor-like RCC1 family protein
MPLNASGTISFGGATTGQSINIELDNAQTGQFSLGNGNARELAGVLTGAISISNFYSKTLPTLQGTLWMYGRGLQGELGNNTAGQVTTPVQTTAGGTNWKEVSNGVTVVGAVRIDGTLWTWGGNGQGNLGTNNTISRSTPVQTIVGGTIWSTIKANRACIAVRTNGTLWTWGANASGVLGINSTINRSTPVQTTAGGTNWSQLPNKSDLGDLSTAIKTDGTLWTWGYGLNGGLGNNAALSRSTPVQTTVGGTNWNKVSTDRGMVAAIKTDGTLWVWGNNGNGELGGNDFISRSTPVQTIVGGTNWKHISASASTTLAIKTDGTLWGWGSNQNGKLFGGGGPTPVLQEARTYWKDCQSGEAFTIAIRTDGTLWGWGFRAFGQLGDNTGGNDSITPTSAITSLSRWKMVATKVFDRSGAIG